ncbi:MAG: exodeoxyribonuclease III [Candidatus Omnitrophica bacterium]|nr:exodeoxyribonuclease III [Candidatus Omnitrophota bacterium]
MKLLSWNVNGIRSALKKGFLEFVKKENPDVLCLQETKASKEQAGTGLLFPSYEQYWNTPKRPGYSGVAVFTQAKPLAAVSGIGISKHDQEGRVLSLEFKNFWLVNVYVPNSKRELTRLDYRTKEWDVDFLKHLKKLEKKKPVVFCGDMNVAHRPVDLANPEANVRSHGFTPEERAGFDNIVKAGFVDAFREFHEDGGHYTWWSLFNDCRKRNVGWRIDYFCVSKSLRSSLKDAFILKDVLGSDHCPVGIVIR